MEHDTNLEKVLKRLREINLKLAPRKCKYKLQEILYIGHVLSKDGLKPDPRKVQAITEMPEPENTTDLLRFMGMVKYLSKFVPDLSEKAAALNELLHKDNEWVWDVPQQKAYDDVKQSIAHATILAYFDVNKDVTLTCDASQHGLGAACLQNGRPVAYASRALTETETRYAQIEKELLAVVFACTKFKNYICAKQVTVETDHQPLISITKKPLSAAPARLQRMLMRLQSHDIHLVYRKGKDLVLADALSRAYLQTEQQENEEVTDYEVLSLLPITSNKLDELKQATAADNSLQRVYRATQSGWPTQSKHIHPELKPYFPFRDEMTSEDGVILKGHKIVVPSALRNEYVNLAHKGHIGIDATKRRARDVMFWPNMNSDIEKAITACKTCQSMTYHQQKEPLMSYPVPNQPWATVGTDLFEWHNCMYLITVDLYSGWYEIDLLRDTSTSTIIKKMKTHFSRFGIPLMVISDSGSQYKSREFKQFARDWSFNHVMSSPHFHSSNGLAEKAVQTAKKLLEKSYRDGTDAHLNLLNWRNTPRDAVLGSPAQRNISCRTRTTLPTTQTLLKPQVLNQQTVQHQLSEKRLQQKKYADKSAKPLPLLHTGDNVCMQTPKGYGKPATITRLANEPRSYYVRSEKGTEYRRNRRHLLKVPTTVPATVDTTLPAISEETIETLPRNEQSNTVLKPVMSRSGRLIKTPARYAE